MKPPATYRTVASSTEGLYKEKGSKFISFLFPVTGQQDTEEKLQQLRTSYHDARHHCYAYILGDKGEIVRANDDGEPNHSAGDPILGQLRSHDLTRVLCVVIRYFGGTKLGVSGLINAYKTAAAMAIENAMIIESEITTGICLTYPYESTNEVMRLSDEFGLKITAQQFEMDCRMEAEINVSRLEELHEKAELLQATGTTLTLEVRDTPS